MVHFVPMHLVEGGSGSISAISGKKAVGGDGTKKACLINRLEGAEVEWGLR